MDQATITFIDTASSLRRVIDQITDLPTDPPSLYLDLEGIRLGRKGSISLISILATPQNAVYIVDVHLLRDAAFYTSGSKGESLRSILESMHIPKVFFDIRNDSDALFSHYNIRVNGVIDLQLLELASHQYARDFVFSLAKCIQNDSVAPSGVKANWLNVKERGSRLFDPKKGGRYEVFNERPLKAELVQYCASDLVMLPHLWRVYGNKCRRPDMAFWRSMVRNATVDRIKLSQSAGYDGQAPSKVSAPWDQYMIDEEREHWNDDVWMFIRDDCNLDRDDNWVSASTAGFTVESSPMTLTAQIKF